MAEIEDRFGRQLRMPGRPARMWQEPKRGQGALPQYLQGEKVLDQADRFSCSFELVGAGIPFS